jgi:hypothetical protein
MGETLYEKKAIRFIKNLLIVDNSQSQLLNPGNGSFLIREYHWMIVLYTFIEFPSLFCKGVKSSFAGFVSIQKLFSSLTEVS